MVSNNTIIIFCRPFSFHIIAVYTKGCIQSQFSGFCDKCAFGFGPGNGTMWVKGLRDTLQ